MKVRISFSFFFFFLCVHEIYSQVTFQIAFYNTGQNFVSKVIQTNDGGYLLASTPMASPDCGGSVNLIKTDFKGDTLWTRTILPQGGGHCEDVIQTANGGYLITGSENNHVLLMKIDSAGNISKIKYVGVSNREDNGRRVHETSDGGYFIGGDSFYNFTHDIFLVRTDSAGDTLWTKILGTPSVDEYLEDVQPTRDNGFIAVGWVNNFGTNDSSHIYVVKLNSFGDTTWTRTYSSGNYEFGRSVIQTSDGGYVVTGNLFPSDDMCLLKIDSVGGIIWSKSYGIITGQERNYVGETVDGGLIVAGATHLGPGGISNAYLLKTNSAGDTLWTKCYGGTESGGLPYDISCQQTTDQGYILGNKTLGFNTGALGGLYLIKTDSSGNSGCYDESISFAVSPLVMNNKYRGILVYSLPVVADTSSATFCMDVTPKIICNSVGINNIYVKEKISVFPNPASPNEIISVSISENNCIQKITLLNIFGEIVRDYRSTGNESRIQLPVNIISGIYFLKVICADKDRMLKLTVH